MEISRRDPIPPQFEENRGQGDRQRREQGDDNPLRKAALVTSELIYYPVTALTVDHCLRKRTGRIILLEKMYTGAALAGPEEQGFLSASRVAGKARIMGRAAPL